KRGTGPSWPGCSPRRPYAPSTVGRPGASGVGRRRVRGVRRRRVSVELGGLRQPDRRVGYPSPSAGREPLPRPRRAGRVRLPLVPRARCRPPCRVPRPARPGAVRAQPRRGSPALLARRSRAPAPRVADGARVDAVTPGDTEPGDTEAGDTDPLRARRARWARAAALGQRTGYAA